MDRSYLHGPHQPAPAARPLVPAGSATPTTGPAVDHDHEATNTSMFTFSNGTGFPHPFRRHHVSMK